MKIRFHTMLGVLHSWSIVSQQLARAMKRLGGHDIFMRSTNNLEHFPEDLKPLLLPGYHGMFEEGKNADFLTPSGDFISVDPKHRIPNIEDTNRPYDLEFAYTVPLQYPRRFHPESRCRVAIWNYESSILPPGWHLYPRAIDYLLPSSQYSYDIFANNGVPKDKMLVVPHGVDTDIFNPNIPPFKLKTEKKVKFLFNAIPHARKLHERVFKAYCDAFTGDDDVCLVLKTKFLVPKDPVRKPFEVNVEEMLKKELGKRRNPPEIEIINDIFIEDIGSLYTACDCVVSMSSCEGFCLLPDIEVDTAEGPKPISTVKAKCDDVYSHSGRLQTVCDTTSRDYDGEVIAIRRLGDDAEFVATPEHPHAVVPKMGRKFKYLRKAVGAGEQPVWKPISQIEIGDLAVIPKPRLSDFPSVSSIYVSDYVSNLVTDGNLVWFPHSFRHMPGKPSLHDVAHDVGCSFQHVSFVLNGRAAKNDLTGRVCAAAKRIGYETPPHVSIPNKISLTPEFGMFCGMYLAEGYVTASGNAVSFSSHSNESFGRSAIIEIAKNLCLPVSENIDGFRGTVTISNKIIAHLLGNIFGRGAYNKSIPMWMWNSSIISHIIRGFFYGDGSCSGDRYSFSTSSSKLARSICSILATHNILCHMRRDRRREGINYILDVAAQHNQRFFHYIQPTKYSQLINIPNGYKNTAVIENEHFFFVPIRSIRKFNYCGKVYNLHIDEDHSFTCGGMATHNCLPLLEAMACEKLVIAPRHGGQLEFLNDGNSLLVDTKEMLAPPTHQYWQANPKAIVGDPDVRHCAELMRRVYDNLDAEKVRVRDSAKSVVEKLSWENAAKMILELPIPQSSARFSQKRRKVLYIMPYDMVGGGEVWIKESIKRLDRQIYEPHIALVSGAGLGLKQLLEGLDAVVEDLKEQGRGAALKILIESENYSIIHFYNSFGVYQILRQVWNEGYRCRIVETVHSDLSWGDSMTKVSVRGELVRAIAAISNDMAKKMLKLGNKNVSMLPQHIDWDRFSVVQRSKDILDGLGIPKNYVVGFVGRLSPEKNIPIILKCAQMLPEVSFVLVGDGPQWQPLTQMASGLKNVFFTGARSDVEKFYGAFDALILPSDVEGLPLVILEAMSTGTPVIASDVGAVSEVVIDGMTGLLMWNPRDPSLFARAVVRMRNEPGLWSRCSENSKSMIAAMKEKSDRININSFYNMLFQGA